MTPGRVVGTMVALGLLAGACAGGDDADTAVAQPTAATERPATPDATTAPDVATPTPEATPAATPTPFPEPPTPGPLEMEDVALMRCLDAECGRIQKVVLDEQAVLPPMTGEAGVRDINVEDILLLPDGRPLVLAEWLTPHRLDNGWDDEMVLYTCVDVACSSVTTQVVMEGANGWSGVVLADGSLVISYQTGRQVLCDPTGCADPDRNDLSSLELLICPDPDDCSATGGSGRIVVVDREGMTGLFGGRTLVGPDGTPLVLYERELGNEVVEVRLARCIDRRCSDVTVSTVLEAELGSLLSGPAAMVLPDGSPAFLHARPSTDGREFRLLVCDGPACENLEEAASYDVRFGTDSPAPWAIAANADGSLVVATFASLFEADFVGYGFSVVVCGDRTCADAEASGTLAEHREVGGWGPPGALASTPDGRPMFTYGVGAAELGHDSFIAYTVCDDPTCGSATTVRLDDESRHVDEWDPTTPAGLMLSPLNARGS